MRDIGIVKTKSGKKLDYVGYSEFKDLTEPEKEAAIAYVKGQGYPAREHAHIVNFRCWNLKQFEEIGKFHGSDAFYVNPFIK